MTNFLDIAPDGGLFNQIGRTSKEDLESLFAGVSDGSIKRIAIHFHGGLVSRDKITSFAQSNLIPYYKLMGVHPVVVVWETGLLEIIKAKLTAINGTRFYGYIKSIVLKTTVSALAGGDARAGAFSKNEEEIDAILRDDPILSNLDKELANPTDLSSDEENTFSYLARRIADRINGDDELAEILLSEPPELEMFSAPEGLSKPGSRGISVKVGVSIAKIVTRVLVRHWRKRDHGIYCTVVEEIMREFYIADLAGWAWQGMKEKASLMSVDGQTTGACLRLLNGLAKLQNGSCSDLKIDFIAHSAGSIAVSHLLEANIRSSIQARIESISLLAPACTHDQSVVFVHDKNCGRIRMFTMSDEFEKNNSLVSEALADEKLRFIYPRSLLYFVSGVLENEPDAPILGMARFLAGFPSIELERSYGRTVTDFFQKHCVYSPSSDGSKEQGFSSGATKHGDFTSDPQTLESVKKFMLNELEVGSE